MSLFRDSTAGLIVYYASGQRLLQHTEDREHSDVPQKLLDAKTSDEDTRAVDERTRTEHDPELACPTTAPMRQRVSDEETVVGDLTDSEKGETKKPQQLNQISPLNWSVAKKSFVTFDLCFLTFAVYVGSSIYSPGIDDFAQQFGTSVTVATLGMTLFAFGYGIGPMFLSPLIEVPHIARNPPYMISLFIFVVLQVPTVLATNVPEFLVLRFLAGFWGSAPLATPGGSIADMFAPKTRAYAMGMWGAASVCGPVLGPLIGGFAAEALGWRWSLWPLLFLSGGTLLILTFVLPETSAHNILYRRKERLRRRTGNDRLYSVGERTYLKLSYLQRWPFQLMLTEPIVLSLNVYIALIYSILYVWFESFPLVFEGVYGFSLGIEGVAYVGILVGAVVTYACYCVYAKLIMESLFEPDERGCVRMIPEDRLPPAFVGCWCIPICMFFFGWTSTASIHWIVPIIGSSFFPAGSFLLFQSVINYLPDCNPDYAASIPVAGNGLFRAMVGGAFPLFAKAMFENLQKKNGPMALPVSWGCTLLGCLSFAMGPLLHIFRRFALHDDEM
ncbi:major facilitator superfamily domain-containing protein [Schizophyllum amplum]|uniref:Major facilitator superfamily domain-containing protein n=1 Tax=Schizophyllum amplum TaxID=97359 RepID=A0A550C5K1_9AGAR|nr:major facilitator superfamily domain-containing protein [Auriculariopsis ampla]